MKGFSREDEIIYSRSIAHVGSFHYREEGNHILAKGKIGALS